MKLLACFAILIYLMLVGCRQKRIGNTSQNLEQTQETLTEDAVSLDGGCFQLPLAGPFRIVKAFPSSDIASGSKLNTDLFDSENVLRKQNGIEALSPRGQFVLDAEMRVVGFSLRLFDHEDESADHHLGDPVRIHDYFPMHTSFCPTCNSRIMKINIRSLAGIDHMDSIAFIDFSSCLFLPGIWDDLLAMSATGSLRGISLWNGDGFLDVRGGVVAPKISGLAVNISDASRLSEFSDAFPSLSFLAVTVSDRKSVNTLFGEISQSFPNLMGLMISSSRWPGSEFDQEPRGRETNSLLRISPKQIPSGLKWICMDGRLMALGDMTKFDEFGAKLRYKRGHGSSKLAIDRNIDVLFMGFGYSNLGARSMHVGEYQTLENYWNSKQKH